MGWGYGVIEGKKVGYTVEATCEHEGCAKKIDRGLAYKCGDEVGSGEYYYNGFFCGEHLFFSQKRKCFQCERCLKHDKKTEAADE